MEDGDFMEIDIHANYYKLEYFRMNENGTYDSFDLDSNFFSYKFD